MQPWCNFTSSLLSQVAVQRAWQEPRPGLWTLQTFFSTRSMWYSMYHLKLTGVDFYKWNGLIEDQIVVPLWLCINRFLHGTIFCGLFCNTYRSSCHWCHFFGVALVLFWQCRFWRKKDAHDSMRTCKNTGNCAWKECGHLFWCLSSLKTWHFINTHRVPVIQQSDKEGLKWQRNERGIADWVGKENGRGKGSKKEAAFKKANHSPCL